MKQTMKKIKQETLSRKDYTRLLKLANDEIKEWQKFIIILNKEYEKTKK